MRASQSAFITMDDITLLFANVEVLLKVNQELLDGLEKRTEEWDYNSCIGDFFLRLASFFKLYTGTPPLSSFMTCSGRPYESRHDFE